MKKYKFYYESEDAKGAKGFEAVYGLKKGDIFEENSKLLRSNQIESESTVKEFAAAYPECFREVNVTVKGIIQNEILKYTLVTIKDIKEVDFLIKLLDLCGFKFTTNYSAVCLSVKEEGEHRVGYNVLEEHFQYSSSKQNNIKLNEFINKIKLKINENRANS